MSQATFQSAIDLHLAGQLEQAEKLYLQILAREPGHSNAVDLLGVICAQRKQFKPAIAMFQQAIALRPDIVQYYQHLAQAMIDTNRPGDAIACFRQIVALDPTHHAAMARLGTLLGTDGKSAQAIEAMKSAVALKPDNLDYRGALASAYMQGRRPDLATIELRELSKLAPDNSRVWHNLGAALSESNDFAEGLAAFERALELSPGHAAIYSNMSAALRSLGRHEDAMAAIRLAVEIDAAFPGVQNNLGALLADGGDLEGTLAAWRLAVAHEPGSAGSHWNYARVLLQLGHFAEGWEEFEWRLRFSGMQLNRGFAQPQWNGSDPNGKTILLHAEGGFGDALHFIRLVRQASERGGRWLLECQPELTRLLEGTPGVERVIPRGQPLPEFDMQIPLQGLPRVLGIRLENIPNKVPYVKPAEDRVRYWAERIGEGKGLRVGLVWAGSKGARGDTRSRTIELFAPLFAVEGIRFFNLQKGSEGQQSPPAGVDWTDFTSDLADFAETAALVQNLDLVVTIDTSMAHLAGALAKPVWVLIQFQCDFRWLTNRTDSPWYPTMRLFREPTRSDSATPIAQIVQALREFKSC